MGPKQRLIAALSRPKPRGKRIVPVARDKELRTALLEIAKVCKKYGIRLSAIHPAQDAIAVFDIRHERPAKWPIAAFVGEIGGRLKGLQFQSIMPDWDRYANPVKKAAAKRAKAKPR
jgi:hypothetical protein